MAHSAVRVIASFRSMQFSHPAAMQMCLCPPVCPWACWYLSGVWWGSLIMNCYLEAAESNCPIDTGNRVTLLSCEINIVIYQISAFIRAAVLCFGTGRWREMRERDEQLRKEKRFYFCNKGDWRRQGQAVEHGETSSTEWTHSEEAGSK